MALLLIVVAFATFAVVRTESAIRWLRIFRFERDAETRPITSGYVWFIRIFNAAVGTIALVVLIASIR